MSNEYHVPLNVMIDKERIEWVDSVKSVDLTLDGSLRFENYIAKYVKLLL